MDDKHFDSIIRSKLQECQPEFDNKAWEAMERRLVATDKSGPRNSRRKYMLCALIALLFSLPLVLEYITTLKKREAIIENMRTTHLPSQSEIIKHSAETSQSKVHRPGSADAGHTIAGVQMGKRYTKARIANRIPAEYNYAAHGVVSAQNQPHQDMERRNTVGISSAGCMLEQSALYAAVPATADAEIDPIRREHIVFVVGSSVLFAAEPPGRFALGLEGFGGLSQPLIGEGRAHLGAGIVANYRLTTALQLYIGLSYAASHYHIDQEAARSHQSEIRRELEGVSGITGTLERLESRSELLQARIGLRYVLPLNGRYAILFGGDCSARLTASIEHEFSYRDDIAELRQGAYEAERYFALPATVRVLAGVETPLTVYSNIQIAVYYELNAESGKSENRYGRNAGLYVALFFP